MNGLHLAKVIEDFHSQPREIDSGDNKHKSRRKQTKQTINVLSSLLRHSRTLSQMKSMKTTLTRGNKQKPSPFSDKKNPAHPQTLLRF